MRKAPGTIKPKEIGKDFVVAIIILLVVFIVTMLVLRISPSAKEGEVKKNETKITSLEQDLVNQAKLIYNKSKEQGIDFTRGPCLSDNLASAWVVDIAHNPRQAIDDLPENQCPSAVLGKTTHFVELDPEGNLIRIE